MPSTTALTNLAISLFATLFVTFAWQYLAQRVSRPVWRLRLNAETSYLSPPS